ncbi:MAG TPA: helix-turn-helix domain-containing protein [Bacteroidetes bacterium]|nr:helix-turn-helix domain-containing protein [Bacteroidota bacterium]
MKNQNWKYLFLLLCNWLAAPAHAQSGKDAPVPLDSLVNHVRTAVFNEPEIAVELGLACLQRATEEENKQASAKCGMAVANAYYHLGKPWKAKEYIRPAIAQATGDLELHFNALLLEHSILCATGEAPLAWGALQSAQQLLEGNGGRAILQANLYNEMGYFIIYFNWLEKAQGKEFLEKALEIYRSQNDKRGMARVLRRLGRVAETPGEALGHYQQALVIFEEENDLVNAGWTHFDLGLAYRDKKDFSNSLAHFNKALDIHRCSNSLGGVADIILEIGRLYLVQNMPGKAVAPLNEALLLAKKIPLQPNIRDASAALAKAYEQMGDFAKAYPFLQLNLQYKDSTFYEKMTEQIAESNARYQSEQKEKELAQKELELAQQKNQRNLILLGSLLALALISGLFLFRNFQQRQKKKEAEMALEVELLETEKLRELDLAKSQFFTNISHDLRTPLTLIISPLEEAIKQLKQFNLKPSLQLAHRNSQQLLKLVNEILDLARLESGNLEIEQSEAELLPLLRRIFFSFQSGADLKGVELVFDVNLPEGFLIKLDISKFEKIINNLVSNALKFTPKGGRVALAGGLSKDFPSFKNLESLSLTISDTGTGIHPDDLPHVFDRFFQSKKNNGSTTGAGGTGIGLALAKQLANLLGGDLTAESTFGKGSTFALTLPVQSSVGSLERSGNPELTSGPQSSVHSGVEPENPVAPIQDALVLNKPVSFNLPNGKQPRILIVEDNADMAEYLKNALSKKYDCTVAPDGEAALKLLSNLSGGGRKEHYSPSHKNQDRTYPPPLGGPGGAFDLITSDVMMPNMDGFSFREKVNKNPAWRQIPFILLTARTLESDKLKGFRLGVDDYITKPFSLTELEARIHNLLTNKAQREEFEKEAPTLSEELNADEILLKNAEKLVSEKMDDPQFSVEVLAKKLGYSPRHLSRVFGKLTGLSPVKFILEMRLQKARQLLENGQFRSVAEVRYEIGIESASYFTKKFKERFGKGPKAYLGEVV